MTADSDLKPANGTISFNVRAEDRNGTWVDLNVVTIMGDAMTRGQHRKIVNVLKNELMVMLANSVPDFHPELHTIRVRKTK